MSLIDQQRVAIAGASGYIGGRLSRQLLERGVSLRVLGRRPSALKELISLGADAVVADVADRAALRRGLEGIDVAYYLVHSM
ncbi:MAG TPA: NAD(P)H-binding protein, partial [Chloroflexota bacterium]|nr:NAD(P)H-binding protein [Chloroflexota bacterium]